MRSRCSRLFPPDRIVRAHPARPSLLRRVTDARVLSAVHEQRLRAERSEAERRRRGRAERMRESCEEQGGSFRWSESK